MTRCLSSRETAGRLHYAEIQEKTMYARLATVAWMLPCAGGGLWHGGADAVYRPVPKPPQ